ncbi:MAG: methionine--tRNA ligase [Leptospira sp.]|nr:methionine--tRNA ligase [Leptospira sp.]
MPEKILVTTALPYANGSIHLGHVLEGIQADIWVRFQRAIGNTCYFFCADDTHGTPIMLAATKAGVTPDEFIQKVHKEHFTDLTAFGIEYNNYYTTNSPENKELAEEIYLKLKEKGNITARNIEQTYCEHDKMFLPDRFIKGTCPKCGAKEQYGDSCEVCGATYDPTDLKEPHCAICGNVPVLKESKHLFFRLQDYQNELKTWIESKDRLVEGAKKKILEWFGSGLKEWDISRDGPYFGFQIPGEENKYFYVWLDAPIGYMAASKKYFENNPDEFNELWKGDNSRIVHFIGKDILYFHGLFWPAMLMGAEFNTPTKLHVHGFMTVGGEKMSKSRGTFINASTFAKYNDTEHFRYYMAARLGPGMDDVDISFEDFLSRVNSDLIGNLVNIVSRVSTSLLDKLDRTLGTLDKDGIQLLELLISKKEEIQNHYEDKQYHRVIREITSLGDSVNKYVNDRAPWVSIKTDPEETRKVITVALNAARILFTYLYPVVPNATKRLYTMLGIEEEPGFHLLKKHIENIKIGGYVSLSNRPNEKSIQAMIDDTKAEYEKANQANEKTNKTKQANGVQTKMEEKEEGIISIEDLTKVELRVGLIEEANHVEGADKLIQVTVNLGEKGKKNVFAGIKSAYSPEDLVGLKVVVVANLKPRKMKFGMSEAMLLASGNAETLSLFVPHKNANPGDLLK